MIQGVLIQEPLIFQGVYLLTWTDENGSYTFNDIPIGLVKFNASKTGYILYTSIDLEILGGQTTIHNIILEPETADYDDVIEVVATCLMGNYPNPFNPVTSIKYQVSGIGYQLVQIDIYNLRGQKVRSLVNDYHENGEYSVVWDGTDDNGMRVGSGVYFYNMRAGEYQSVRRMVLLK